MKCRVLGYNVPLIEPNWNFTERFRIWQIKTRVPSLPGVHRCLSDNTYSRFAARTAGL